MKKFIKIFFGALLFILVLIVIAPYLYYYYGLSLIPPPVPKEVNLTEAEMIEIWSEFNGIGNPVLKKIGPWGYIQYFLCIAQEPSFNESKRKCDLKFKGVNQAFMAVKLQIIQKSENNHTSFKHAWFSYGIWAMNNWSIEQVLSTLRHEYPKT